MEHGNRCNVDISLLIAMFTTHVIYIVVLYTSAIDLHTYGIQGTLLPASVKRKKNIYESHTEASVHVIELNSGYDVNILSLLS